jgi:hypothetical protein
LHGAAHCETKKVMGRRWGFAVGVILMAPSARAGSVDIRCPKLAESSKSELEARAQLLLSSAKMSAVSIAIDCESDRMWLVWFDGRRLQIDTSSGVVEGSLDAIEDFLTMIRRPHPGRPVAEHLQDPEASPAPAPSPSEIPPIAATPVKSSDRVESSQNVAATQSSLEGGVVVSTLGEWWGGGSVGIGPRFEVGVRFAKQLAFVLAEGTRFGVGASSDTLAFDLQGGLSYGAPYANPSGVGLVVLGGAERVNATTGNGGWLAWRATASLGLRVSGAVGSVDLWAGPEIILRSGPTETIGSESVIPQLSGMLSVGCLFPAFGPVHREPVAPTYAVQQ